MSDTTSPEFGINSWLEDELYLQYLHDHKAVDESWKKIFESNGGGSSVAIVNGSQTIEAPPGPAAGNGSAPAIATPVSAHQPASGEQLVPLRGPAARIAENMTASLSIPVATSQRIIPVKVIDENRRTLNETRGAAGKSKLSYTHLIGWAIVKALQSNPALNHAYAQMNGEGFRAVRAEINLGLAVDVAGKDGARSLKVPNIKNAGALTFEQFL